MTIRSLAVLLPGLALAALLAERSATPLGAQEAGPLFILGQADHPELPNPHGWGAFAAVPLAEWAQLRVSYERVSQNSRGEGLVCTRYAPNLGCAIEATRTESGLGSLRLSLLPTLTLGEFARVGAGGGISFTEVTVRSTGASGRKANLDFPNTGQLGYLALASLTLTPSGALPLRLVGATTAHWINFKNCVSYDQIYDPFCGTTLFREVSLGVAIGF